MDFEIIRKIRQRIEGEHRTVVGICLAFKGMDADSLVLACRREAEAEDDSVSLEKVREP